MTHLIFFRGLSTYGHDHAQMSVFKFGPMFKHLARALGTRDVAFHPVLGMGVGPLREVARRAERAIEALPVWVDDETPVHLVGHSAGGLVARLVLDELGHHRLRDGRPKIASVLTVATPHLGSGLARIFIDMPERYRTSAAFFRAVGYDLRAKTEHFGTLTDHAVARALAHVDEARHAGVRTGSVVCAPRRDRWSRPMRAFHLLKAFREFDAPSDGMVERDSQVFGDRVFEVDLDHFQQAGFFGGAPQFASMCDAITEFAKDVRA